MAKLTSYLRILEMAPAILGAVKQLRGTPVGELDEDIKETKRSMDDVKKQLFQRLDDVETENKRLQARLKEMESTLTIQKVLIYTSSGVALIALVLSLIAIIRLG